MCVCVHMRNTYIYIHIYRMCVCVHACESICIYIYIYVYLATNSLGTVLGGGDAAVADDLGGKCAKEGLALVSGKAQLLQALLA